MQRAQQVLLYLSVFSLTRGTLESFHVCANEPYAPLKEETATDFSGLWICGSAGPRHGPSQLAFRTPGTSENFRCRKRLGRKHGCTGQRSGFDERWPHSWARGNKLSCLLPWLNFLFASLSVHIPMKGTPVTFRISNCVLAHIQGSGSSHSDGIVQDFDESSLLF